MAGTPKIAIQITMPDGTSHDASYDVDSVLIGSGPSALLRIEDSQVSSIHAVIKRQADGGMTIIDLGSEAGTVVNGSPISEPTPLRTGDRIRLGRVGLVLKSGTKEPAQYTSATEKALVYDNPEKTLETDAGAKKAAVARVEQANKSTDVAVDVSASGVAPTKIRERIPLKNVQAGSHVVTADQELDLKLLDKPLPETNRPTNAQRVLEIVVRWGDVVIDAVQVHEPRDVTVGGRTHKRADLKVEGPLPADFFTIAKNGGGEATIIIPADSQVAVRKQDGSVTRDVSLDNASAPFAAKSFRLGLNERVAFKVGTLTFVSQYVKGDAKLGAGTGMDWYFPRVFAISALVHAFFVVAAFITPEGSGNLVDDLFKNQNRFAQMILKAQEKEKKAKKLDLSGMKGGAKHKGDEGKFGKKDKPKKDALASKAGAPRVDPNKREKDRKVALNSGLLGILKGAGAAGAVSNVFGPGGLGTGINNAMGGLRGSEMGDAGGAGGLGTRGTGAGGGGNSLGIGGLGTHGHGNGTGGYGNIDLGGRGKGTTRIVPGKTIIQGSLSKEEIGRVIRRNLARFKYCYEKQLNANPNLQGKIAVYFTIAPTGDVASASIRETSMGDENVESCAIKVMRSLVFPKPRGGGIVVVTYPFVFAAT